jgi:choline-sulfatase
MSSQPNILFIVSDQMTAALTGVYGHPVVQTPHLERLAERGARFDAAYTPFPLCSPGRACIMTGRHASEIGAWDNGSLLAADEVTFAHYLDNAGYDTVLSGKMHFVGPDQLHGFHRRLTTDIYSCHFDWVKPEWIRLKETQGRDLWDLYEGAEIDIPDFPDDLDDSYSLLDRNLNAYHGTRRHDLRDPDGLRRLRRAYYALVTYMDRKVGELLDVLEETGLADNTVVVFTSDHGDMLCEKEMVQKRNFYEWSCRVPLLMSFPDGWKAGSTFADPVSLLDLLPTFCELAGEDAALPHDGQSLLGQLAGGGGRTVFAQAHEAVGVPCVMAREGRFKYNYIHGHDDQLFDLQADPGEWCSLVHDPAHRDTASDMRGAILRRFDPDRMAAENLESLYRRRHIRDAMKATGTRWTHFPRFDAGRGALDQYLP